MGGRRSRGASIAARRVGQAAIGPARAIVAAPGRGACPAGAIHYINAMPRHDPVGGTGTICLAAPVVAHARFTIGDVVRHRLFDFRGVVFDVDPVFANTDEWYEAIPEAARPRKDQPFYHLLAENGEHSYIAYVSQQNLVTDDSDEPIEHPAIHGLFHPYENGRYALRSVHRH